MSVKLSQRLRVNAAVTPQDIQAAKTSPFVSIAGASQIMAAVTTAALGVGKKAVVQFLQATDAGGTGSKALGAPVEKVATAAGPVAFTAEAYAERLDEGFGFVAVQLSSDNGAAVLGSAMLISGDNRFNP
ncbi:hypothetical protein [Aureimonas sp. SK2]|uniref:hypothetical protein n=1 Tax=Aureimonas sp. SK2 TaxID=3015992 RepID=UPI0024440906|nr:hypothetical protein [Aureimonas sp. SK2]